MKGIYLILAAVFIMLMISPAAYSTESSNLSMGYFKEMESNVTVICESANSSDFTPPHERMNVSEVTGAECSYGGRTAPSTKKPEKPYTLAFVSDSFTPTERLDSRIQDKLTSAGEDDYTYCFVMISGRTTNAKRDALTEQGVKLLGYFSHHCYRAKIPLNRIEEIGNLSFVRWIGYAPSDLKIHPTLKKKISSGSDDEIRVYINVFDSDLNENSEKIVHNDGKHYYTYIPNGPFQNKLEEMGVTILAYDDRGTSFTARATPDAINQIVDLDFVHSIAPELTAKLMSSQGSPSIDEQLESEANTDEPSEQEELTTGDSNPGIATIVQMAFAYIQRRLI